MHTLKMAAALALGLGCCAAGADAQQLDVKRFAQDPDALKAGSFEKFSVGPESAAMLAEKPESSWSSELDSAVTLKARGSGLQINAVNENLVKAFQ